jgi:hypothetical protein
VLEKRVDNDRCGCKGGCVPGSCVLRARYGILIVARQHMWTRSIKSDLRWPCSVWLYILGTELRIFNPPHVESRYDCAIAHLYHAWIWPRAASCESVSHIFANQSSTEEGYHQGRQISDGCLFAGDFGNFLIIRRI